ncbi:hypothetical protein BDZ45DRAFT_799469 [Acephala macrosclerotiorum]|nr:hypothetical protein BDZ45DRAFT_799469 [Acephala macrosclerotiorum]
MSDTTDDAAEKPRLRPKQIRASAIVRNIVKYYSNSTSAISSHQATAEGSCHTNSDASTAFTSTGSLIPSTPSIDWPEDTDHTSLRHDPTLTAFAQLGAFRLNVPRAIISLIDHEYQWVVAEATRSVSLQDPTKMDPGDELWCGTIRVPQNWGLCPETIHTFNCEDGSMNKATEHVTANQRCYVINDLAAIECFKDKPYVVGPPFIRFYAEVPLKTRSGYIIGGYCVVDDKPRADGLDTAALDKLIEVAAAVMDHLELVVAQDRLQRSQQMMQGLGRFVDGKSVRQWWKEVFNEQFQDLDSLKSKGKATDESPGFVRTLSTGSEPSKPESHPPDRADAPSAVSTHNRTTSGAELDSLAVTVPETGSDKSTATELAFMRQITNSTLRYDQSRMSITTNATGFVSPPLLMPSKIPQEDLARGALKLLFSRASHLIKQSSDLDGIIFLDASLQDIAVTNTQRGPESSSKPRYEVPDSGRGKTNTSVRVPERSTVIIGGSVALPDALNPAFKGTSITRGRGAQSPVCDLLGYALQGKPNTGVLGSSPLPWHLSLPQSTLRGLLQRYPQGEVFLFNEDGVLLDMNEDRDMRCCGPGEAETRTKFERKKEQLRAYQLMDICPGARAIIFFPLWDPQKDQWFAGSLAWTKDPGRLLQKEDVTFLAGFGSCIMAEKSKMDALSADRAKIDFISSVSHELRSPLHGILATTESLNETTTDLEQDEMIRIVSSCGEVLLDTLDHVLDYAKISNNMKLGRAKTGQEIARSPQQVGRITTFDLCDLVETAVEGIFAGYNHRKIKTLERPAEKESRLEQQRSSRLTPLNMNPNVMIIVEIQKRPSYVLESQRGAWKRILTNLFGNALKYTEGGFVRVGLRVIAAQGGEANSDATVAVLEIEDSGIGISKDFLKHRLYTPFSQENPHSAGTGLGLSIVRQLVADLEGTIDVGSEQEYGTGVKVTIPLVLSTPQQSEKLPAGNQAMIRDIAVWCKRLKLCLIGFEYFPELDETPTGILTAYARRMLAIRSSISTFATDWFGLEICYASSITAATGDIFIGMQSKIKLSELDTKQQPLIVFEDFYTGIRRQNGGGIFYMSQPVGPHKMARMLGLCLDYKTANFDSSSSSDSDDNATASSFPFPTSMDQNAPVLQKLSRSPSERVMRSRSGSGFPLHSREPLYPAPLPSPDFQPEVQEAVGMKARTTVLLVEDNPVNMKILVNHMNRAKEEHISAFNGLEAVKMYQADPDIIKVIFMDVAMPVKDGIEATREIRTFEAENNLPRVRIAAVTCFSSAEYQRDAFAAGVDLFLVKPVPMKALKPILEMDPNIVNPL